MAIQVSTPEKKENPIQGMAMKYVDTFTGGMGSTMQKDSEASKQAPAVERPEEESSPVSRRMEELQQQPRTQLQSGMAELNTMDPETQKTLAPVLQEALKREAEDRKRNQSTMYPQSY